MLPPKMHKLTDDVILRVADRTRAAFLAETRQMMIDDDMGRSLVDIYVPLAACLAERADASVLPPLIGINGAQGSGKTTLCRLLQIVLEQGFAKHAVTISIDDIYLPHAARAQLANTVHPLLQTRGVPGTHDVALGLQLLASLRGLGKDRTMSLPVFDKAIDDRLPEEDARRVTGPVDLILFEGWCVGARPQQDEALAVPVNSLERLEDPDLAWRRYVNQQLNNDYARLFAEIDFLIMLKVPGMDSVMEWRGKQERKLAERAGPGGSKVMDRAALQRFIMHYERLTRAMLAEMPERADLVLMLNQSQQICGVRVR